MLFPYFESLHQNGTGCPNGQPVPMYQLMFTYVYRFSEKCALNSLFTNTSPTYSE